eukprot:COSAG05_NODE_3758_length_1854_cov_6.279202_1_plen_261_part_10
MSFDKASWFGSSKHTVKFRKDGRAVKLDLEREEWKPLSRAHSLEPHSPLKSTRVDVDVDESGEGFKYEVQTKFIGPGKLGFEFKEDDHGDGLVVVSKVHRNSTAAGMRNVCVGMVLVRVQAGRSSSEVAASELGFDGVMDLMSQRPLTLTFEHPWQKEVDDSSGRVYYYNSHTDKSDWTKPRELDEVVDAMREWASDGSREAESASSRGADSSPFRSSAGCGSGSGATLDESGEGFKYEVQTKFIGPGKLGFEFKEDDHGD